MEDKNSAVILSWLYYWPLDLCDPEIQKVNTIELVESKDPNIYLIDAVNKSGWRYRFTIDKLKNFNVTMIECIRLDGSYDWINTYIFKQYGNNDWFMDGWERKRWPPLGEKGEAKTRSYPKTLFI